MLSPRRGFTLVEMMIVIALFIITAVTTVPLVSMFNERQTISSLSVDLLQTVRRAQGRSISGVLGQPWGIYVDGDEFFLFAGNTYVEQTGPPPPGMPANERHKVKAPFRVCNGRADKTILFPQNATAKNVSMYIQLYSIEPFGEQRFILIDTVGTVRLSETHPLNLNCKP